MTKLWAIHIPGPDEYHAAPSEAAAKHMADRHTAAMQDYVTRNKLDWGHEMIAAAVVEWPFDSEVHSDEIEEFDYVAWGLEGGAA